MKRGIKRLTLLCFLTLIPFGIADTLSTSQEANLTLVIKHAPRLGTASWYSQTDPFINRHTANGEVFDDTQLTCASWDYPFNTQLQITNLKNNVSVICRVNDRGPARRLDRIVDLSKASFKAISPLKEGLISIALSEV